VPTLLLVRHAQASFGGADYDVLSARGHDQVRALVEDLRRRDVHPSVVISGSLRRQRDTGEPIAAALGAASEIDESWNEYATADVLEHHSSTDVREDRQPGSNAPAVSSREFQDILEKALLQWIAAGDSSPASEPWPVFAARVADGLTRLAARLGSGETGIACTSGGVLAAVCVALLGLPADRFVTFNRVTVNAGVTRIAAGPRGMTLVSFNEQGHLEQPGGSLTTYR
jgi:broad specificity phosphatase PhoE